MTRKKGASLLGKVARHPDAVSQTLKIFSKGIAAEKPITNGLTGFAHETPVSQLSDTEVLSFPSNFVFQR